MSKTILLLCLLLPISIHAQVHFNTDIQNMHLWRGIQVAKMLSTMGTILGLVETLIAMSPALVGLSTGDIGGMTYNMQVVYFRVITFIHKSIKNSYVLDVKSEK